MDADDYTQPPESVAWAERGHVSPRSLRARDRRGLFALWCEANPGVLDEMERMALDLARRGKRVSAKYLIEKERYEGACRPAGVPFFDEEGRLHRYAINNSDAALITRWLLERHPGMDVRPRRLIFDEDKGEDEGEGV
ncbi:MAG: hypothetical protein MR415_03155 [Coriobacteriaceae bacterium]|nr:hypothetical protein [Coriobacteriaceae bacterium]